MKVHAGWKLGGRAVLALGLAVAAVGFSGCMSRPFSADARAEFVSGSASADGWTTPQRPTSIATPASPQAWSDSISTRAAEPAYNVPPPPPPPAAGGTSPVVVRPSTTPAPCAPPPCAPAPAPCPPAPCATPAPTWCGCGLPCEDKISQWHVRGVFGWAFFSGTDAAESCLYWGADLGRTFCGCWGLSVFYRYNSGRFDREGDPSGVVKDGGAFHHVGVKLEYERSINRSHFYVWGGIGPEYFWTQDYLDDDSGFGVFGELGIGYVINQNFRIRAGLNVHGMETSVGRKFPADDGNSRWLWIVAPVIEGEVDF
jgi:hypothetical protein